MQLKNILLDEPSVRTDNGYVSLYWYDAGGNRTVKEHGGGEAVWVNLAPAGQRTDSVTYTIYPSPYISVTGDRWTKHYYVGSERIASRTGTLSDCFTSLNIGDSNSAGNGLTTVNYGVMCSAEESSIDSIYSHFGVPYETLHTNTWDGGWHLYLPITHSVKAGDGEEASETAGTVQDRSHPHLDGGSQVYYYHRDHLGSTMSVTDSLGATVQLVEYTPWGEVFVERRFGSNGYESPYLFNGKELDEETGLYYYGARYYDPKMSVWYGVDPVSNYNPLGDENHIDGEHNGGVFNPSNLNPYIYCYHNPIKYVDPNGKQNVAAGLIGGGVGGLIGGGVEAYRQWRQNGSINNWRAVGGAAARGVITGGFAGLTNGASLSTTIGTGTVGNVLGGLAERCIRGERTTTSDVLTDALIGGTISYFSHGLNKLLNSYQLRQYAKIGSTGKVGEDALKVLGGKSHAYFSTTSGKRYVDQLSNGIANESKVGYTTLTTFV